MFWARLLVFIVPLASAQSLGFETFKTRVEPIFLKKRPGHARCVACHVDAATAFKLQSLATDAKTWTDEQLRKNFEMVLKLVTPGDPKSSRLLIHPLARDGGGDQFRAGGRQFASKDDPDWKIIADWIIEETRRYIRYFDRLATTTTTARELFDKMLEIYPDRINPGALWSSARDAM